ncbi:MAG: putative mariner transposase [Streblomastix strix]|uniref:Putative mariner transposase n=1 Tax=Streblomastix strix TaxID=222440 RepID=A0A5J4TEG7_9EUKA|nr:MAG: putative mariner transposase [Streblomastix strix]
MTFVRLTQIDWTRFHSIADFLFRQGKNHKEVYEELLKSFNGIAPEENTVYKWHVKFLEGNPLVSIAVLPGRPPITGLGPGIEKIIQEDKYITLTRLAAIFGIAKETVRRIIIEETSYIRVGTRFIPHRITPAQKQVRVQLAQSMFATIRESKQVGYANIFTGDESYIFYYSPHESQWAKEGDSIDERPKHCINDLKVMLTTFWNSEHVFVVHWTPFQTTMNATMFTEDVLKPLQKQVKKEHNTKTIQHHIHFDNAAIHRANYTQNFISKGIFKPMKHPPYSPDLAPSDFYLFSNLKKLLKGCDFKTEEEVHAKVEEALRKFTPSQFQQAYENWIHRLEMVILTNGEYYNKK